MINFFKKVFAKKGAKEPEEKPVKVARLLRELINLAVDKEKLKENFPKEKKEEYSRQMEDGLRALNASRTLTREKKEKVNKIKIINLIKLVVIYGENLETLRVEVNKK
jgi:hypothetical protein